jgi:hypothetical protein
VRGEVFGNLYLTEKRGGGTFTAAARPEGGTELTWTAPL